MANQVTLVPGWFLARPVILHTWEPKSFFKKNGLPPGKAVWFSWNG